MHRSGYDKSVVTDPAYINWNPLVARDRWTTTLAGIRSHQVAEAVRQTALFDSGSSSITGPAQEVHRLYQNLKAQNRFQDFQIKADSVGNTVYEFDCATPINDFVVSFEFNNVVYDIPRTEFQIRRGTRCQGVVSIAA